MVENFYYAKCVYNKTYIKTPIILKTKKITSHIYQLPLNKVDLTIYKIDQKKIKIEQNAF